ncbi:regulator of G-protein signaling 22 [Hoplias malabaricus]|uniref:regulator of G-protein signaling 22 n=1 Tax=Hoplias malabaricus TaxID=27720 RepID=UPI003462AF58
MREDSVPDFPEITTENLDERLSSDSVLVEFLNEFLMLPMFLEPVRFNKVRGVFEVGMDTSENISAQISSLLKEVIENSTVSTWFPTKPLPGNSYTVPCLDGEQAVQWIRKERLPFFLQSDYYFEYRLASCLCHLADSIQNLFKEENSLSPSATLIQQESSTSLRTGHSDSSNDRSSPHRGKTELTLIQILYHSLSYYNVKAEVNLTGQQLSRICKEECHGFNDQELAPTPNTIQTNNVDKNKDMGKGKELGLNLGSHLDIELGLHTGWGQCPHLSSGEHKCALKKHLEISQVSEQNKQTHLNTSFCLHCVKVRNSIRSLECGHGSSDSLPSFPEEFSTSHPVKNTLQTAAPQVFMSGRQFFLDFKSFLQGRPGERILNLWMDIERLKTLQNLEARNRHLIWMKNQYLVGTSSTVLSVELLSRLGLISPHCWTEERLQLVQPHLTVVLLLYWGRRFIISHSHTKRCRTPFLCWDCQLPPPRQDSCPRHPCNPQSLHSGCYSPSRMPSVSGPHCSDIERMVQALCIEPRAGFYFTHFCQNAGNQLWANAAEFYRELLEYRQLFYRPSFDPYRVQHKAQLLYATFVSTAAGKNVHVGERCRQHIFTRLNPPFEELFDQAEEHTLFLLLEPWTVLIHQDITTFNKVAVWEEERFVEPELYKALQSLYIQIQSRQQQRTQDHRPPPPPPQAAKEPDPWAQVPLQFRRYRFGTLLRNRVELQHFLAFLEENFASTDLLCWLDIEQLKRTPSNAPGWEEKHSNIRTQYLSRNYLFGPSSPANKQQQTELIRLAGGWARLQGEPLSVSVLSEVQSLVRSRIERKWLPLFLSSKEFNSRQKLQAELGDVVEDQLFLRHRKKRQVWKQVDSGLMNISQEVLALRKALLNPVTCLHFRLFLSTRGELLENDLLFWLEVQRYKDLCHSHCDEATVQKKISTIISCFIDSCIPPSVQIHLPPEQAQLILQSRSTLGPYIFREAQMCVFSELMKHWPGFVEFRSSVCEEQVLFELEKRRAKEREKQMRGERDKKDDRTPAVLQGERGSVLEGLIEEASMYGEVEDEETEEHERMDTAGQQLSWSYSKYLAALEREEMQIHTQALQEEGADLSSVQSVRAVHTHIQHSSRKNTLSKCRTHIQQRTSTPVTGH